MDFHLFTSNGCRLAALYTTLLIGASGCDLPFQDDDTPGWMNANITGAVVDEHQGSGAFEKVFSDDFWTLSLTSEGVDSRGLLTAFSLSGFHVKDPKPGTYPLRIGTNAEILNGSDRIFAAVYSRWNDARDNGEAYRSQDGEVVIRDASGSRISGSFSFVAFELCPDGPAVLCPGDPPSSPPPGARLIEVSGTFEARLLKQGQSKFPEEGGGGA